MQKGFFTVTEEEHNGESVVVLYIKRPGRKWRRVNAWKVAPSKEDVEEAVANVANATGLTTWEAVPKIVPIAFVPNIASSMEVSFETEEEVPEDLIEGTALQMFTYLPDWKAEVIFAGPIDGGRFGYTLRLTFERVPVTEKENVGSFNGAE